MGVKRILVSSMSAGVSSMDLSKWEGQGWIGSLHVVPRELQNFGDY